MSIDVMNLVWASTLDGPHKRFALLALADSADDNGQCITLGVPKLCRKTGIPRSTMFRLLRELETDALILREEQLRANGSRKASCIWINVPLLKQMRRPGSDDRDMDEPANPFEVSAAQPPVPERDGTHDDVIHTPGGVVHTPSRSGTGVVPERDGTGVPERDRGSPGAGPLIPSSVSEKDPDPETDGRIDPRPEDDLTAGLAVRIVAGLTLRCDPTPRQVGQITAAIAGALARGVAPAVVAEYARRKAREADTCKYLIQAFTAKHLPADVAPEVVEARPAVLPPCGQCDAQPGEPIATRLVEGPDGKQVKCPRCHPHAIAQASSDLPPGTIVAVDGADGFLFEVVERTATEQAERPSDVRVRQVGADYRTSVPVASVAVIDQLPAQCGRCSQPVTARPASAPRHVAQLLDEDHEPQIIGGAR